MEIDPRIIKENRERLDVPLREFTLDSQMDQTTPELMMLSTFELLNLLKVLQKECEDIDHSISLYRHASQPSIHDTHEAEKETGFNYMYYTKKVFVVENIIRCRLGYVPHPITDDFLLEYWERIQNDQTEPMIIRTKHQSYISKK
jgi:hypothetical protein